MLGNLAAEGFRLTLLVSAAFDELIHADLIVVRHISVIQNRFAALLVMAAPELELREFLFYFLADAEKFRLIALHRTFTGRCVKFLQTFMVESALAALALERVDKYALTEAAQVFFFELVAVHTVCSVQHQADVTSISVRLWLWA